MKLIRALIPCLTIILIIVLVRTFFVTPIIVTGESMKPALQNGEILLLNKIDKDYERFDVVVLKELDGKTDLIKRIIALPNEIIEYNGECLYINGEKVADIYANGFTGAIDKIKLDENEYFVLGDNRENSRDSREFGIIVKDEILGKANIVIYPFNKMGKL